MAYDPEVAAATKARLDAMFAREALATWAAEALGLWGFLLVLERVARRRREEDTARELRLRDAEIARLRRSLAVESAGEIPVSLWDGWFGQWAPAFRIWFESVYGRSAWIYREKEHEVVDEWKRAFRAGWRSAVLRARARVEERTRGAKT